MDAIRYARIFDFPLTREEVYRFVSVSDRSRADIDGAIGELLSASQDLETDGTFIFQPGAARTVGVRLERKRHAERVWRRARFYARIISALPFVRMVAVTGALSMDNVEPGDDIDYLVVTKPGRVWTTRAMIILIGKVARKFGDVLCPNYIVSALALTLPEGNLYAAHELVQMVPLYGAGVAEQIYAENQWFRAYLPNAEPPSFGSATCKLPVGARFVKAFGERLLELAPGNALERWERTRKIEKLSIEANANPDETQYTEDICKGHHHGHALRIMQAWYRGGSA
jgi:hypothetical protein